MSDRGEAGVLCGFFWACQEKKGTRWKGKRGAS